MKARMRAWAVATMSSRKAGTLKAPADPASTQVVTPDRQAMELVGQGVQLCGEDKVIGPDGSLLDARARPSKASELFTTSYTRLYPEIAARSAVFAQLRNLVDLLVAAAFLRQQDYYGQAQWTLGSFGDQAALPVESVAIPKLVIFTSPVASSRRMFWGRRSLWMTSLWWRAARPEEIWIDRSRKRPTSIGPGRASSGRPPKSSSTRVG